MIQLIKMFNSTEQETYIASLLKEKIEKLTNSAKYIKWLNYFLSIAILFLSAALTVILGFNFTDNTYILQIKNTALIIGAFITFLSGLKAFWKLEIYWVRRKIMLRRMQDLQDEFNFAKLSTEKFELDFIFQKYQSIQDYKTDYWENIYNESKSDDKGQQNKTDK